MSALEAFRRPAEEKIIRGQEYVGTNSSEIVESLERRASEALDNFKLIAALQGEEKFKQLLADGNDDSKIEIATKIIAATPFILKLIPEHLTKPEEQAGFLVAVAKVLAQPDKRLN